MYNAMMGTLMYFITLAILDSGLLNFHTIQKGIGAKRPRNLYGQDFNGQSRYCAIIKSYRTYIANGIIQ